MRALARRLAAVEHKRAQHQHRRIVWPSVAAAVAAGVSWPILVIGDTLPADEWAALAKKQQADLLKGIHDEKTH